MKLQAPFIQLPLMFDASVLAAEVAALEQKTWKPHPQGFPGNSMLPLVAVDGDPDNEGFAGVMRPTPSLQRCPYLTRVFASFGAPVGRSRLMRLAGQAEVTRHADQGYYWTERVRIHVPIVTQPTVRFECGDADTNMKAGECWIFDTWRLHRVVNDDSEARIHLVCDTVGGAIFWELVAQACSNDAPTPGWQAHRIAPGPRMEFDCEASNVPVVMTPWELSTHLGFLFSETVEHPQLPILRQLASRLLRQWRGLWAIHGDSTHGWTQYRASFDTFIAAACDQAQGVILRNDMRWYDVLIAMLDRAVVATNGSPPDAVQQKAMGDNA